MDFKVQALGPDLLIQRWILRRYGITLFGPKISKIVAPVTGGELRDAMIGTLRTRWLPQLEYPGQFLNRRYQAYAVITMCRAICLLATGELDEQAGSRLAGRFGARTRVCTP